MSVLLLNRSEYEALSQEDLDTLASEGIELKIVDEEATNLPTEVVASDDIDGNHKKRLEQLSDAIESVAKRLEELSASGPNASSSKEVSAIFSDYTKTMTDFASAQAELSATSMAAFAEVAKKVQMETVELMLSAGKNKSEDASAAVKKATNEITRAAKASRAR